MLEKALNQMAAVTGKTDRHSLLCEIDRSIEILGLWNYANLNNLLDADRTCEEFSIEFMTAYNKEVSYKF